MTQPRYRTSNVQHTISRLSHVYQRQSAILGPLEWTNLFGPSNKVVYLKKLVFGSGVHFSILFVLVDAILLRLDLQKRTSYKIFFSILYTFVKHFCTIYPKSEMYFAFLVYFYTWPVCILCKYLEWSKMRRIFLDYLAHCQIFCLCHL